MHQSPNHLILSGLSPRYTTGSRLEEFILCLPLYLLEFLQGRRQLDIHAGQTDWGKKLFYTRAPGGAPQVHAQHLGSNRMEFSQ